MAQRLAYCIALVALFGTAARLVLSQEHHPVSQATRHTQLVGDDRLVSVEPLPPLSGPMCESGIEPGQVQLMASLQNPSPAVRAVSRPAAAATSAASGLVNRDPVRVIHDPY